MKNGQDVLPKIKKTSPSFTPPAWSLYLPLKLTLLLIVINTVDSRYLDFGYLEQPLISKKKSGPCLNIEI